MERPNPVAAALVCLSTSALPRVGEVGALDCEDLAIMHYRFAGGGHRDVLDRDGVGEDLRLGCSTTSRTGSSLRTAEGPGMPT